MARPVLRLWLFGDVRAEFDGRPVRVAARPLCAVLLAMLVTRPGTAFPRETLATDLWPDERNPARAKGNLRRHLSALIAALPVLEDGSAWIEADGPNLTWPAQQPVWCDASAFEAALADPNAAPEAFLIGGDFMRDYQAEWVVAERENYRARSVERLLATCVARQDDDRIEEALQCANAALQLDPLCEEAVALAIELHGERGDALAAGQLYASFAERLHREVDSQPSAATSASLERVRGAARRRFDRLPRALTSFVGRGAAVNALTVALERSRCVTVVGAGGLGKTRLALETARGVAQRFADGTAFVDFSALPENGAIADAVVRALELPGEFASDGLDGVIRFVRNRRVLLVLDNCEHVRERCASFASDLLERAPRVTILATSRAPLAIGAETIYRLEALSAAEARALFIERSRRADEAASATGDALSRIDRICETLDRSPLAVELAAGLARHLALADIETRLADRFAMLSTSDPSAPQRHRTLEATISWSFELLEPGERRVFERLAVFPSSFTFDAALEICEASPAAVLSLIEKSLVQHEDSSANRYRLLFSLAAFAQRRFLRDDNADSVRDRHAERYAALLTSADSTAFGEHRVRWFAEVEQELENVRAALRHLLAANGDRAARGVRAALASVPFFVARGFYGEGLIWLEAARMRTEPGSLAYADALTGIGRLLTKRRDFAAANAAVAEAASLYRSASAKAQLARALAELAAIHISCSDVGAALPLLDEAHAIAEEHALVGTQALVWANRGVIEMAEGRHELAAEYMSIGAGLFKSDGDLRQVAFMLNNLAGFDFMAARYDAAMELLQEALAMARAVRDPAIAAGILCDMGDVLLAAGRPAEARRRFDEALAEALPLGIAFATAHAVLGFAGVAAAMGDARLAARLVGMSAAFVDTGLRTPVNDALYQRTRDAIVAKIGEDEFERLRGVGRLLELEDVTGFAAVPGAAT